jgi:hypothetical protein
MLMQTPRGFDRWNDTYAMAKFHWEVGWGEGCSMHLTSSSFESK